MFKKTFEDKNLKIKGLILAYSRLDLRPSCTLARCSNFQGLQRSMAHSNSRLRLTIVAVISEPDIHRFLMVQIHNLAVFVGAFRPSTSRSVRTKGGSPDSQVVIKRMLFLKRWVGSFRPTKLQTSRILQNGRLCRMVFGIFAIDCGQIRFSKG